MEHLIEGPMNFFEELLKKYRYQSQYLQKEQNLYQDLDNLQRSSISAIAELISIFLRNFPFGIVPPDRVTQAKAELRVICTCVASCAQEFRPEVEKLCVDFAASFQFDFIWPFIPCESFSSNDNFFEEGELKIDRNRDAPSRNTNWKEDFGNRRSIPQNRNISPNKNFRSTNWKEDFGNRRSIPQSRNISPNKDFRNRRSIPRSRNVSSKRNSDNFNANERKISNKKAGKNKKSKRSKERRPISKRPIHSDKPQKIWYYQARNLLKEGHNIRLLGRMKKLGEIETYVGAQVKVIQIRPEKDWILVKDGSRQYKVPKYYRISFLHHEPVPGMAKKYDKEKNKNKKRESSRKSFRGASRSFRGTAKRRGQSSKLGNKRSREESSTLQNLPSFKRRR